MVMNRALADVLDVMQAAREAEQVAELEVNA